MRLNLTPGGSKAKVVLLLPFFVIAIAGFVLSVSPRNEMEAVTIEGKFRLYQLQEPSEDGFANLMRIIRAMPSDHGGWVDPQSISITWIDRVSFASGRDTVVFGRYEELLPYLEQFQLVGGVPATRSDFEKSVIQVFDGPVGMDRRNTVVISFTNEDIIHLVEIPFSLGLTVDDLRVTRAQGMLDKDAAKSVPLNLSEVLCWISIEVFDERRKDDMEGSREPNNRSGAETESAEEEALRRELRSLEDLAPAPYNPRRISGEARTGLE
jgi:hypothetical protein